MGNGNGRVVLSPIRVIRGIRGLERIPPITEAFTMAGESKLIHEETTEKIIGEAMAVLNELVLGWTRSSTRMP